ncbi:MAG: anti-sigma factor [Burkholderiales bacterium]|nr:anti-sigma factor [Burkholderiales bacterium]
MSGSKSIPAITDSDCLQAMDHLYAYLDGELGDHPETFAIVEHHLGHCKSCFSRAEMERVLNERLKESGKGDAPDSLKKRLRKLMNNL